MCERLKSDSVQALAGLKTATDELREQQQGISAQSAELRQISSVQTQFGLLVRNLKNDFIRSRPPYFRHL